MTSKMWNKFQELTALQWRYLVASWLLLPVIDLALRAKGYKRTRFILSRFLSVRAVIEVNNDSVNRQIARAVSIAAKRSLWPTSCLRQALLYWWFMGRRGTIVEICFGIEVGVKAPFAAHAWVERQGNVLLGGEHVRDHYLVLRRLSRP